MESLRLATFNVENLFARYRFADGLNPVAGDGFTVNSLAFDLYDEVGKKMTAQAVRATNADVICLQEVESLPVLDRFNSRYLASRRYRNRLLIDGNDPRQIDVAVLSKEGCDLVAARSHRDRRRTSGSPVKVFSRDCLEVDIEVADPADEAVRLTLFVNHFKSMIGGRQQTRDRRLEQSEAVHEIVTSRFGGQLDGYFVILGDFNDYPEPGHGLTALLDDGNLINVVAETLPADLQWTHYYNGGDEYRQLDYVLVSRTLWEATHEGITAEILRDGLPYRAGRYEGPRFDDVGEDHPKASDHCPVAVTIPLAGLHQ